MDDPFAAENAPKMTPALLAAQRALYGGGPPKTAPVQQPPHTVPAQTARSYPVGHEHADHAHGVEDRHPRRVHEGHEEEVEQLRVADRDGELGAEVELVELRLAVGFLDALGAWAEPASIPAAAQALGSDLGAFAAAEESVSTAAVALGPCAEPTSICAARG